MASFELRFTAAFFVALVCTAWLPLAEAQQQPQGFAVERFYPAPPGSGWFVMDDLDMSGGLGGAVTFTNSYSRNPLDVASPDGATHIPVVSNAEFINLGVAGTYDRYRIYFDFPMPLALSGTGGTLGPYQLSAPVVSPGTSPDGIVDPRVGLNMRMLGVPGGSLRLGAGAELIFPSGERSDYASDGTYRGMFRLLAAGDRGGFSYAGLTGVHVRSLNDSPAPGSPAGSEFLFGSSVGRKFSFRTRWSGIVGTEIYGETAFHSFFNAQRTAVEGLLTARLERTGSPLRFKLGGGHGFVQHFGAPEWRVLFGVELVSQMSRTADPSH
jgi:OmpA-OmpF porin, OOP family